METKRWWLSKTVWANLVMAVAIVIQATTGEEWLDAELQGALIVIINLILRLVTKQPVGK